MNVGITTVALGGIYPRLAARMLSRFEEKSPGFHIKAWVNTYPPGTHRSIDEGYDYTPYIAKPYALKHLMDEGFEIGILLDAAFFPVQHLLPLIEHIQNYGYYFCDNEFKVGEWCSDLAMQRMGATREALFEIPEISSYCVGVDFRREEARLLVQNWCYYTRFPGAFEGRHTAGAHGRNPGFVSEDPRVKGHRHDQTVLSIIAHRMGMQELVKRPRYTAYAAKEWNTIHPTDQTVLVNWGRLDADV